VVVSVDGDGDGDVAVIERRSTSQSIGGTSAAERGKRVACLERASAVAHGHVAV
jgi:hypothetical protein